MALSRAEADTLFNYALGWVRSAGVSQNGNPLVNRTRLAARLGQHFGLGERYNRQDMLTAVERAVGARRNAWRITADPENRQAVPAREYTQKPVLDRTLGDYEYQVVVILDDGTGHFETRVTFQSVERLGGVEIFDRARDIFQHQVARSDRYRNKVRRVEKDTEPDFIIVSASRFEPRKIATK